MGFWDGAQAVGLSLRVVTSTAISLAPEQGFSLPQAEGPWARYWTGSKAWTLKLP